VHIDIDGALTGQTIFAQVAFGFEFGFFGFGHGFRFAAHKFNFAGRAACFPAAAMQRFAAVRFQSIYEASSDGISNFPFPSIVRVGIVSPFDSFQQI
jgi:hypothetical protein